MNVLFIVRVSGRISKSWVYYHRPTIFLTVWTMIGVNVVIPNDQIPLCQPSWHSITHSSAAAWLAPIITGFCYCIFRSLFKWLFEIIFQLFSSALLSILNSHRQSWTARSHAQLRFPTGRNDSKFLPIKYVAASWLNDYPYKLMWLAIKWFQRPYSESDLDWVLIGKIA